MKGPITYENWKAVSGPDFGYAFEFPLYTDRHVTGSECSVGPYTFINTVALARRDTLQPGIVVYAESYYDETEFQQEQLRENKTDDLRYHGGWVTDELASLAALALGIPIQAGPVSRRFNRDEPQGRPIAWTGTPPVRPPTHKPQPSIAAPSDVNITELQRLDSFVQLAPAEATMFVRAARLYQDGLWVAESEPHLAWLLFVSAVETLAQDKSDEPPVEQLRGWGPGSQLEQLIVDAGVGHIIDQVAKILSPVIGSQAKFLGFLKAYGPNEPPRRPGKGWQHSWEPGELRKTYKLIYQYRSKALHEGRRFPAPMCESPVKDPVTKVPSEVPIGLASAYAGGVWEAHDTPMLLHVFEFITRRSLLGWLSSKTSG